MSSQAWVTIRISHYSQWIANAQVSLLNHNFVADDAVANKVEIEVYTTEFTKDMYCT